MRHGTKWAGRLLRRKGRAALAYLKTFLKWAVCAVVTGLVCGAVGAFFHLCIEKATELREAEGWLLYLLPVAGLAIVGLYQLAGMLGDSGTNTVIQSIRSAQRVPLRMAPLIFVSTVLSHLCGASVGREGAALQIGGSVGHFLGRFLHLEEKDLHIITMCGMSAVFSALFGTPVTAAIFSMEVISVGVMYYVAFLPCILSAAIASLLTNATGTAAAPLPQVEMAEPGILPLLQVGVLAALCAVVSILFCIALHQTERWGKRWLPNPYLRAVAGGVLLIVMVWLAGTRDYCGAGMEVIGRAMQGEAVPWAFLLKIVFTAVAIGSGFKGGEIVPTLFIGAVFGNVAGGLLGLDPAFGACIGMVALFCGVVNCPIASLLLGLELFGGEGLVWFAAASAVSYLLSGYYSLYSSQKIVYSKLHPDYIDRNAK